MPPATLRRVRRAVFLLLFAALALSSCGGGNDQEDVQSLLDKAFSSSIKSANLSVDATIQVKGSPGLQKPLRITATLIVLRPNCSASAQSSMYKSSLRP